MLERASQSQALNGASDFYSPEITYFKSVCDHEAANIFGLYNDVILREMTPDY